MAERLVRVNGVDLCVDTFGDPEAAAILLISGASASMDWWDAAFCQRLARGERFVIRYDHRDTGRSPSYPPGRPGYTGDDLVGDAVGLIDALAGGRAHVVGLSMGGGIAQQIAVEHPDRVATLTLMSTSPAGPGPDNGLPPIADRLQAVFTDPAPEPDWSDRAAVIDYLVDSERAFAGPGMFHEAQVREVARLVTDRTSNMASSTQNHMLAEGGADTRPRLGEVAAPTLVIHGTADPLFPFGHAEALAREIPEAELLALEGVGHQAPPPSTWDLVVPAILQRTSAGELGDGVDEPGP